MRRFFFLLLLVAAALPAFAVKRVTVEQLEQLLAANKSKPDARLAQQLSDLELTERLSAAKLSRWQAELPGAESRLTLLVLADQSGFLDAPVTETPATDPPDLGAQREMLALTAQYAKRTISKLPDFFATRDTLRFEDTPGNLQDRPVILYRPLHPIGRSKDTVLYRNGREVIQPSAAAASSDSAPALQGLNTTGVFGPILGTVLVDTAHGKLEWSHWEREADGIGAVFRYAIAEGESHYKVDFGDGSEKDTGYHGVIEVNPLTGAILRLVIEADLKRDSPIARSGVLVEYGPLQIGGQTYLCPVKSVSIWRAASGFESKRFRRGALVENNQSDRDQLQTSLNDVAFEQYHLFRADTRVIPDENANLSAPPPSSGSVTTRPGYSSAAPEETGGPSGGAHHVPVPDNPPATGNVPAPTRAAALAPASALALPEAMAADTGGAPELPASRVTVVRSSAAQLPTPTLRVSSRIVYVDAVVRDGRGQIVRGLTQNDFRVFEDGAPQKVDLFSGIIHASPVLAGSPSAGSPPLSGKGASANRPPDTVNMVLFDLLNTSLPSQLYARKQMLKFLAALPPGYKIAVFVLTDQLHMLQNFTGDSETLAETARLLLPRSSFLFQSGSEQMRSTDILGLLPTDMRTSGFALDLLEELSNEKFQHDQTRNDVTNQAFRQLAQTTAAIPGRKNLLWLSESFPVGALATLQSAQSPLGSRVITTGFAGSDAGAQVLSGSRMAIYPISIAGLETGGVTAGVNGTTAAGGNGSAISGGAIAGNGISTVDPELTGGLAAAQPGAQGGSRLADSLGHQAGARIALRDQMDDIATQTGGEAFLGTNDIAGALRKSLEEGQSFYSLAYASTNKNWNGKFRKIHVELARKGYSLSYRRGYFALPEPAANMQH
jgi:VWFA-related protein